jgi:uncharacterized protein YkwD
MGYQPRRNTGRLVMLLLCGAIAFWSLLGMAGTLSRPHAHADDTPGNLPRSRAAGLDVHTAPMFQALNKARARANLPKLAIDENLVDSAERDACAMARGELPLSEQQGRLEEAGAQRENVGLVVDTDPDEGARTMHEWWNRSREHQVDRMDPSMHRYGIGACTDEERTYYVERFAF